MTYRMFACYCVETDGRATWSLNGGDSPEECRDVIIAAGKTWTPPTYYTTVQIRELSADENAALEDETREIDAAALEWWDEHNNPAVAPAAEEVAA